MTHVPEEHEVLVTADRRRSRESEAREMTVVTGTCEETLPDLPSNSHRACVTSPPYWGLRDYGDDGTPESLDEYLGWVCDVMDEVRRVLTLDGTLWVNIGDSHSSGGRRRYAVDDKNPHRSGGNRPDPPAGVKPKDLIGVPWALAFALRDRGWYLRQEVIWHRRNCVPESVTDRPHTKHERLFMLSRSKRYFHRPHPTHKGSVWDIPVGGGKSNHPAPFPEALARACILSSTSEGDRVLDPFSGSGTTGVSCVLTGREFTGIESNEEYASASRDRIRRSSTVPMDEF